MIRWWRKIKCKWFHKRDHVCWDDLFERDYPEGIPGKRVWLCNRCKRSWAVVNHRVFATDCADERGVLPEKYYPHRQELVLQRCKCHKEKKNARTESSRTGTGRSDEPVSDATGNPRPDTGGKHSSECSTAGDGNSPSSV